MSESSGMTLMDLITSDTPTAAPSSSSSTSTTAPPPHSPSSGKPPPPLPLPVVSDNKKSKKGTLMQIQSDTISAAKAAAVRSTNIIMPQKHKHHKKPVSYAQLARSIHELAASSDQKSSQKQLVHHVFPKLAVYNSVDPSLAPSLLMLGQQCEDRTVLRYVYYYLARILSDTDSQGLNPGGGIPTPNWDALADIDAVGGVTRADVVPRIVDSLGQEAMNEDIEFHARRLQALKALTYAPSSNSDILTRLYDIVFGILDKVADEKKRKKGIFGTKGGDKEFIIRSNLQYAALSALRRLPLDPGNPAFLHRAVQGVLFADPIAVRHSLEILSELASKDPYAVAMALGKHAQPGGALQDVLHLHDVLARVALARLCHAISRARSLDERPDIKSQFNNVLYQLLLDPSDRVCFEAILCVLGKNDGSDRTDERAGGWYRLTREILKLPEAPSVAASSKGDSKDSVPPPKTGREKSPKTRRPQLLLKLVMRRLEGSFRSFSRPVLHAAARVVHEMGKSRAAAFAVGLQDIDEGAQVNEYNESMDEYENPLAAEGGSKRISSVSTNGTGTKDTIASLLASLMEVVRTTVACECVYVRAMVIKALIWMQSPNESFDELGSIIASELSDPAWPATLLNDVLLTLHARFKATPDMAVTLLEIARIFATKVPGKIDADVLQLLWKEEDDDDDMAQSVQTFETILKRKLEMTAEDLIRTASTLTKAASTLCQPSSNLSPSPSTSLPGEKGGILTCGEGLEVCTKKPDVPLVPAFYRAMTTRNLKPTCTDIKGYLAEAGKTVDDESIQNLLLRVQEKGWQEVAAYHYEQVYSLPPGTGHQRFKVMDKERRCYSPESVSSGSMFPPAEKDVIPPEKRPKPYPTKGVVHRAYYKATYEQGIKYPTLSDIKRIMEDLWRSSYADAVGIPVGFPEHPIPDEEIESIRLNIKASGVYMK